MSDKTSAQQDEREAFDIWFADKSGYHKSHMGAAWGGWKARAAQVQADAGAVLTEVTRAIDDTNVGQPNRYVSVEFLRRVQAALSRPAAESDKMWKFRYETLRALYPSAPSEEELDIAIRAAMSREQGEDK